MMFIFRKFKKIVLFVIKAEAERIRRKKKRFKEVQRSSSQGDRKNILLIEIKQKKRECALKTNF